MKTTSLQGREEGGGAGRSAEAAGKARGALAALEPAAAREVFPEVGWEVRGEAESGDGGEREGCVEVEGGVGRQRRTSL